MASQTLRLFGFVVHPARVFMHTGGAYHLAKPMVKRTTTRLGPLLPEIYTLTEAFLLFLQPKLWHNGKLPWF